MYQQREHEVWWRRQAARRWGSAACHHPCPSIQHIITACHHSLIECTHPPIVQVAALGDRRVSPCSPLGFLPSSPPDIAGSTMQAANYPAPKQAGTATLTLPDGTTLELPILLDSNGDRFVDIRKLQPRWVEGRRGLAPPPAAGLRIVCAATGARHRRAAPMKLPCWRPSPAALPAPAAAAPASAPLTPALAPLPPASPASPSLMATRECCCTAGAWGEGRSVWVGWCAASFVGAAACTQQVRGGSLRL